MRLSVVGFLCGLAAAAPGQSVRAAVAAAEALGARTGVCVLDADGQVLFHHRATEAVQPASNMKVLTAVGLLRGLGADYRFVTRFELQGGALVVRASGDPNWITGTVNDPLARFGEVAAALQRRSVGAVREVVLDPGPFTGPARPADWPQNQLHTWYCAPTGPFVLDEGVFELRIDPAGRSDAAAVTLVAPRVELETRGAIELVGKRGVSACGAIDRGDSLLVRGKLSRRSGAVAIRSAVADPAGWYERALRQVLAAAGIDVDPAAPAAADGPVHEVVTTLAPAVLRILEDSSNFTAEQCVRALGAERRGEGSLAAGMAAFGDELRALVGELPQGVVLADGSGLSQRNRVTPALVAATLHLASRRAFGEGLWQALPIAGRTGTLEDRFVGSELVGRVRAKTGWIAGASALSGYVETAAGVRSFSILMDYDRRQGGLNKSLKQAQERIVEAIAAEGG